jgi:hypothetical protein
MTVNQKKKERIPMVQIEKKSEKSIALNELYKNQLHLLIHAGPKSPFLFTRKIRVFMCLG